jgi:hypothetical protein
MSPPPDSPQIVNAPAYRADRGPLQQRMFYNFADYGFTIPGALGDPFEIVPITVDEDQAFLFLFTREDIAQKRYSLFNLHVFLKYSGSLVDFAHSRGESVSQITLTNTKAFGTSALAYDREILMCDLFKGGEQVIDFIGGKPDLLVRDSHTYLTHRHAFIYSGMIHLPGDEARHNELRSILFNSITLV